LARGDDVARQVGERDAIGQRKQPSGRLHAWHARAARASVRRVAGPASSACVGLVHCETARRTAHDHDLVHHGGTEESIRRKPCSTTRGSEKNADVRALWR
jgi:hypothetical protein